MWSFCLSKQWSWITCFVWEVDKRTWQIRPSQPLQAAVLPLTVLFVNEKEDGSREDQGLFSRITSPYILVCSRYYETKSHRGGGQHFTAHSSGDWMSETRCQHAQAWGALCQVADFLCSHVVEGAQELFGASFIRHCSSSWGFYSHDLSFSQWPHL